MRMGERSATLKINLADDWANKLFFVTIIWFVSIIENQSSSLILFVSIVFGKSLQITCKRKELSCIIIIMYNKLQSHCKW